MPGEKIEKLLLASGGDFTQLEVRVKKVFEKEEEQEVSGQWVDYIYLSMEKHWDDDMIEHSKQWAIARGVHRVSSITGRDQWRLPLKESFSFKSRSKESAEVSAESHVEAGLGWDCVLARFIYQDESNEILKFNLTAEAALQLLDRAALSARNAQDSLWDQCHVELDGAIGLAER